MSDDGLLSCLWEGCGACHFTEAEALYAHITNDHVGRKSSGNLCLECKWEGCTVKRTKRDHITSHIRVHVPLKPYRCNLCTKSFKRPQDLKKHERTHMEGGGEDDDAARPGFDYAYYHGTPHTPAHTYASPTDGSVSPPGDSSMYNPNMPYGRRKSPYTPLGASPIHGYLPHIGGETNYYPPGPMGGQGKRGIEAIEQFQQTIKKCRTAGATNQGHDALFSFLQQNRDLNSLDLMDLPASLQTASELQQLNEGVLKLIPDLTDVSGRASLIDQLVQQLDSSNPSNLNDILMLGNLQSGPTADPLLSMTSTGGLYTNMSAPVAMSSQLLGFDLTASPESSIAASGVSLAASMSLPLTGSLYGTAGQMNMMYPSPSNPLNPTLTDLASVPSDGINGAGRPRMSSASPAMPGMHDASVLSTRPIARPRGHSVAPPGTQAPLANGSLYSNLYTPMQLQQAQQQAQFEQQMRLQQQQKAFAVQTAASMMGYGMQRVPMPSAQVVDPATHQAHMNALMVYRAMGLQCRAPEDADGDGDDNGEEERELSLDEWLDSEKLTENEVAGGARSAGDAVVPTPSAPPMPTVTLTAVPPTPEPTPMLATLAADEEEPELEDTERGDHYSMRHPTVKNSILVQRSSASRSLARPSLATASGSNSDSVGDEPVSYLRKRSGLLHAEKQPVAKTAAKTEEAAGVDSAEDRQQLLRVAMQLLARINTLYARKMEEEKKQPGTARDDDEDSGSDDDGEGDDSESCADEEEDAASDIDELERELDAMNLSSAAAVAAASETDQHQEMIGRLAKLGLSSTSPSCVS
ncbi:hypothetical protein GGH91_001759 [Coemansia sp. RSA 2671]|nr:hypothetical protein LPJ60_001495 [Coemansia sp. RSA 2675]KAJ2347597.1 hypothetical protein GGH91_001759 [Coemansia sp. RSA 2671]